MENIIRDYLASYEIISIINPPDFKIEIIRENDETEYFLNAKKWKYMYTPTSEVITTKIYEERVRFGEDYQIILKNTDFIIKWSSVTGNIEEEIYDETENRSHRSILYVGESRMIQLDNFVFLYDLENYLENYLFPLFDFKGYTTGELEIISNGNFNILNPDLDVFFYIDDGKVNAFTLYESYNLVDEFNIYIRKNSTKIKDEMTKLSMDHVNYSPRIKFSTLSYKFI